MSGLEISEYNLVDVLGNKDYRWDSNFYTTKILYNKKLKYRPIGEVITKSQYGISRSMNEDKGIPIYRMNEIHNMLCDNYVDKFVEMTTDEFETFKLKDGDVLFNRTNSYQFVGRTGIYYKKGTQDKVFASYLVRFNTDKNTILPEYLTVFLNTKYGLLDIRRRSRPSINQTNVNPEEVKEILIPILSMELQERIARYIKKADDLIYESERLYTLAEQILLDEIGLIDFNPTESNVSIKRFTDSFLESGRLDAEYYQPKYDEFEKLIYKKRVVSLNIYDKNYVPQDDKKYKYIELANIRENGIIDDVETYEGIDLPTRARRKIKEGQVLVSSIEGSLSSCALVTKDFNGAICTNGFYVVDADEINSETLLVLIKSWLIQEVLKRECSGTILTSINKADFSRIRLPMVDAVTQKDIKKMIVESYNLRQRSKILLEKATKSVEIAIECGEKTAIEFLKEEKV